MTRHLPFLSLASCSSSRDSSFAFTLIGNSGISVSGVLGLGEDSGGINSPREFTEVPNDGDCGESVLEVALGLLEKTNIKIETFRKMYNI